MQFLLTLLIIAAMGDSPTGRRYPEAITLFASTFDEKADTNFDQWPDAWTRRRGPGFPLYVGVKIEDSEGPGGSRELRIDLDGGAAAAMGPPIAIDPTMACALEVWVKTEGLKYDRAFTSITFLDFKHRPIETLESRKLEQTTPWTHLRLGPITPRSEAACFAIVGLHLEPEGSERREDLRGQASFADVWLGRMPQVTLTTSGASNLFTDANRVEVSCTTTGFVDPRPVLILELSDIAEKRLAEVERRVDPVASSTAKSPVGRTVWRLPLPGAGFYRMHARVQGLGSLYEQSLTVVVIEPLASMPGSPFGWCLPRTQSPADLARLSPLVTQAGLGWIKVPLWYPPAQCGKAMDPLVNLLDRLQGIETIGVLDDPPEEVRKRLADVRTITAADVFAAPADAWSGSLESLMSRLGGQVRWWQLGSDRDLSFVDYPHLSDCLRQTRATLGRLGGDLNLGIPWGWLNEFPSAGNGPAPWRFLTLSADPALAADELGSYLDATRGSRQLRFVEIEPLSRRDYALEQRAVDLVRRMIAARIHGADAVFVPRPIGSQSGLLADDGTAAELFLPWRTTALLLGGAGYVGSFELPGNSINHSFSRSGNTVMVAWSHKPCEESLYLGEQVRIYDLWGRGAAARQRPRGQVLPVGPLPVFVTGLNESVARWRMEVSLGAARIESIYGRPHDNVLRLKNTFTQPVSGRATFAGLEGLTIDPRQIDFRLARGESLERPFQVSVGPDAASGLHPLQIDFELQADRVYHFAAYRSLEVGLGDVYIEVRTHLNPRGDLVVEQEFVNTTAQKVTFRCQLFAPGRQLQTSDVLDLATGRVTRSYLLPKGEELLGRHLWIRAQEVDGPRVLNYRIAAER
jgi:hypothetical protein